MDTKHLLSFITFAKEGTYVKAAQKLHYAESTIIEHVNVLEKELNIKLVKRNGRAVQLTPNGNKFLSYANLMTDTYQEAIRDLRASTGANGLRIITSESLGIFVMPPIYNSFFSYYPDIDLFISSGHPHTFSDTLLTNEADVALGYFWGNLPYYEFETTVLCSESAVYITNPKHPLANKKEVQPKDLENQVFLLTRKESVYFETLRAMCKSYGINIKSNLFIDSGSLICKYVMENSYISFLPESIVKKELDKGTIVRLDWAGDPVKIDIIAVTLRREEKNPAIEKLLDIAKTCLKNSNSAKIKTFRNANEDKKQL